MKIEISIDLDCLNTENIPKCCIFVGFEEFHSSECHLYNGKRHSLFIFRKFF